MNMDISDYMIFKENMFKNMSLYHCLPPCQEKLAALTLSNSTSAHEHFVHLISTHKQPHCSLHLRHESDIPTSMSALQTHPFYSPLQPPITHPFQFFSLVIRHSFQPPTFVRSRILVSVIISRTFISFLHPFVNKPTDQQWHQETDLSI